MSIYVRSAGAWVSTLGSAGSVTPPPPTQQPPSAISNLSTSATASSITATWDAATDPNGDLDHYEVFLNGSSYGNVGLDLTVTLTSLVSNTSYSVGVRGVDARGQVGPTTTVTQVTSGPVPSSTITHGDQLKLSDVGPAAGGYTSLKTVTASFTLTSTSTPPSWVRVLSAPETFDGVSYPAGSWVAEGVFFSGGFVTISSLPASVPIMLFRGCKFRRTGTQALQVSSTCSTNVTASFCEFGSTSNTVRLQFCVRFLGTGHQVLYRSSCQWWDNALNGTGNVDIIENYVYDCVFYTGAHIDAWLCNTPASSKGPCRILRNYLEVNYSQTGCVANYQDAVGLYDSWQVKDNLFAGGGFPIYAGITSDQGASALMPKNCAYTGNKISTRYFPKGGYYGPKTADDHPTLGLMWGQNGNTWSNNTWADGPNAGAVIPA